MHCERMEVNPPHETHKANWAFLDYASKYWLSHTATFSGSRRSRTDYNCWRLFLEMIPGTHYIATTPWKAQEFEVHFHVRVITWADEHLHIALLRYFLMQAISITTLDDPQWGLSQRLSFLSRRPEYLAEGGLLGEFRERFCLSHASFVDLYGTARAATVTSVFPPRPIGPLGVGATPCRCELSSNEPLNGDLCRAICFGVRAELAFAQLILLAAAWHGDTGTLHAYRYLADSALTAVDGKTAIHLAAEAGHMSALILLVARQGIGGLQMMTTGTRETPCRLATKNNHHSMARFILSTCAGKDDVWTERLIGISGNKEISGCGDEGVSPDEEGRSSDCAERGGSDRRERDGQQCVVIDCHWNSQTRYLVSPPVQGDCCSRTQAHLTFRTYPPLKDLCVNASRGNPAQGDIMVF